MKNQFYWNDFRIDLNATPPLATVFPEVSLSNMEDEPPRMEAKQLEPEDKQLIYDQVKELKY